MIGNLTASSDVPRNIEVGVAAVAAATVYLLYTYRKQASWLLHGAPSSDTKYQAGESYAESKEALTGWVDDLKAVGVDASRRDLHTLLEVALDKGKPLDDKKLTTEKLIAILTTLPSTSKARKKLTNKLIDSLWDNLQHPPLSYMGGDCKYTVAGSDSQTVAKPSTAAIEYKAPNGSCTIRESMPDAPSGVFKYRTPDGSYNNILNPNLGRAGTPYAKSVRSAKKLHGVRPDPGLLFDLLMGREEGNFKENPAGISSVLLYHATIIVHDIFRTNRYNQSISDTSSYLDLAPLYGSSLQDQLEVRTMQKGLLKPDTFHEKRLLGQPPGVNVMLIMYNRFHNYVADILLKINEGGRFTLAKFSTPEEEARAVAKQDNDLFNTARLVVGGLYINITLHDYIRAITNTHHSNSTWTLDPRVEIGKSFDSEGTPRGIGNQVSVEFSLLYRFHSAISQRDEKWTNEFFESLFPGRTKPLSELTPEELLVGLQAFEKSIDPDPSKRVFGKLKRDENTGKFKDEELVNIMKESMDDPIGLFGARMVPKALRVVETLGILQARKWGVASLNEFRDFFGLRRHESMTDINPDPEIANLLENLYTHPDMVELYPGLFIEDSKPRMDAGCGICPPYSVGRAILSDAVTLIRSDRFYTVDYTVANLTNWGMAEVAQDYKTLGGSMFYKLIQRAFPGWFPFNSLQVMQPMYTKAMNEEIAKKFKTIDQYTSKDPTPARPSILITKYAPMLKILQDHETFVVPWTQAVSELFPGGRNLHDFMLAGDKAENLAQHKLVGEILYAGEFQKSLSRFITDVGSSLLKEGTFQMRESLCQIDIIRDVAIPLNARMLADIFYLDMITPENPHGSMKANEMYKCLLDMRVWGFNNNDPGLAWNRRRWAQEAAQVINKSTISLVEAVAAEKKPKGLLETLLSSGKKTGSLKGGSLRSYGHRLVEKLLAAGKTTEQTSDICWLTAFGGVAAPVTAFVGVLNYFLSIDNQSRWEEVQALAAANTPASDKILQQYVVEAHRLSHSGRNLRIASKTTTINGQEIKAGTAVVCLMNYAVKDPEATPDPMKFNPDRAPLAITAYGGGPHACIGRIISDLFVTHLIKLVAGLKNLRPAPGDMGLLKSIQVGTETCYLNDSWSYLTFDPTTWKLHFDGYGKGTYQPPKVPVTAGRNLNDVANLLAKKKAEGSEGLNGSPVLVEG